ncbi:hypothetical protein LCGC14_2217540 [marine sediment metagenome]|uniref:Uncharacterized protein n=1 Tax=marine sediment metagenome TaxID=412755 RepID=A0A0F9DC15_9ZZZZ
MSLEIKLNKKCNKCNKELLATIEYFSINKEGKDGLYSICKQCTRKRNKIHYQKNKVKKIEYNKKRERNFKKKLGISYRNLHKYIRRNKKKPDHCKDCGIRTDKLQLHSVNHIYTRNSEDWVYVCYSCANVRHRKIPSIKV